MEANTPGGYGKGNSTTSTPGQNRTGDLAFRKPNGTQMDVLVP